MFLSTKQQKLSQNINNQRSYCGDTYYPPPDNKCHLQYLRNARAPDAVIWHEGVAPLHLQDDMQTIKILEVTLIVPPLAEGGIISVTFN